MRTLLIKMIISGLFIFLVFGCAELGVYQKKSGRGYGPPPHAPAHGYRHKHKQHGTEMVFDSGLGVYVVTGYPDHFFHNDRYYRMGGSGWTVSVNIGGPWAVISDTKVPPGLKMKKGKGHGKKKLKWK